MPFFNAEAYIAEAIESVIDQGYDDWELLLVDDGSGDGSASVARRYARQLAPRIQILQHPGGVNRGVCESRNLGIRSASADLIAFLDADDVWLPHKLREQVDIMLRFPEVGMVYGLAMYWSSWSASGRTEDDYVMRSVAHLGEVVRPPALMLDSYPLGRGAAPCPSDLLLRREVVEAVGGFEPRFVGALQLYEDQAFLAKVYLTATTYVADRVWIKYRLHDASCVAQVSSAGRYREVRRHFLHWLSDYVHDRSEAHPDVVRAIRRSLWLERLGGARDRLVETARSAHRLPKRATRSLWHRLQSQLPGRRADRGS
jgi:glycosyltransferase involved in cell wall biosynthesis